VRQAAPTPVPTPAPRTHVVVDGDTLTRISVEYYGTSSHWQAIYDANRSSLRSPSSLSIGTSLVIP
jgi:nucleoid-associated protein YgaU